MACASRIAAASARTERAGLSGRCQCAAAATDASRSDSSPWSLPAARRSWAATKLFSRARYRTDVSRSSASRAPATMAISTPIARAVPEGLVDEDGTLHVYDVASKKEIDAPIPRVQYGTAGGSLAWTALAVVLVIGALGFKLPLPFGVVGHEGSTLIVVTNGLRLLTYRGRK